jgi:hypothetical protein
MRGITKCGRCETQFFRGKGNGYCKPCRAAYARENRPKHSELTDEARKRLNCRSYAHVYRDRGHLVKENCNVCGSEDTEMHHENYDEPLKVKWLCRKCHLNVHQAGLAL